MIATSPMQTAVADQPLLKVDGLSVTFFTPTGSVQAIRDASFEIKRGEVVGLVGESGCGKSTTAFAIMGYLPGGRFPSVARIWQGLGLASSVSCEGTASQWSTKTQRSR